MLSLNIHISQKTTAPDVRMEENIWGILSCLWKGSGKLLFFL